LRFARSCCINLENNDRFAVKLQDRSAVVSNQWEMALASAGKAPSPLGTDTAEYGRRPIQVVSIIEHNSLLYDAKQQNINRDKSPKHHPALPAKTTQSLHISFSQGDPRGHSSAKRVIA
jgi:hypothetical protein